MRWILAWHIIFMVAWFAGLFYLPRLFVYHAASTDFISNARFKLMEKKLYYFITTPAAFLTSLCGIGLLSSNWTYYSLQGWMQLKLALVIVLWLFHLTCGYILVQFQREQNRHSDTFFRWFNEIPTILLIGIVILVVVKPSL